MDRKPVNPRPAVSAAHGGTGHNAMPLGVTWHRAQCHAPQCRRAPRPPCESVRSLHPGPHAADVAFRTVLSFLGGPRFFETFTPLPQWTAAPFARDDFFFPRLQANIVLQCFVISCQTSNPKENVCTLPPHRSAVPVGSVRFVLFLHFFFFFMGKDVMVPDGKS